MLNVGSLLNKFKNIKSPKEEKDKVLSIINNLLGYEMSYSDIDIKNKILYIKSSGYVKTDVFMKKERILNNFKKDGLVDISDIK